MILVLPAGFQFAACLLQKVCPMVGGWSLVTRVERQFKCLRQCFREIQVHTPGGGFDTSIRLLAIGVQALANPVLGVTRNLLLVCWIAMVGMQALVNQLKNDRCQCKQILCLAQCFGL